jgi:ABC-type antimicrobial peptide transport system permease subunit
MGGVVGGALGVVVSAQTVLVVLRLVTGWRIGFDFPLGQLLMGIACATIISAIAGYVPARAAARLDAGQRSVD